MPMPYGVSEVAIKSLLLLTSAASFVVLLSGRASPRKSVLGVLLAAAAAGVASFVLSLLSLRWLRLSGLSVLMAAAFDGTVFMLLSYIAWRLLDAFSPSDMWDWLIHPPGAPGEELRLLQPPASRGGEPAPAAAREPPFPESGSQVTQPPAARRRTGARRKKPSVEDGSVILSAPADTEVAGTPPGESTTVAPSVAPAPEPLPPAPAPIHD